MLVSRHLRIATLATAIIAVTSGGAFAQKKYDTGASDTEIKVGNIMPYSGPASAYGVIGKTEEAYFKKINAEGGINGRKITFVTYDDAYSPPKAVEQVRKLVESDDVLFVFNPLGTPSNSAIQKYLNGKKIPQLFVATGATKWNDPKNFPWTMGWQPSYQSEGRIYAKYLLKDKPGAKVGVLFQNDDFGKDYLKGLKDGLGDKAASMIVMEESYETSEPSIDGHIVKLKASGADALITSTAGGAPNVTLTKQMRAAGVNLPYGNLAVDEGTAKGMGADAAGIFLSASYVTGIDTPANKTFLASMAKKFGAELKTPNDLSVPEYEAVYAYKAAVEKAGSTDQDKVLKALAEVSVDGPRGSIKMDKQRHAPLTMYLGQVQADGSVKVIQSFANVDPGAQCPGKS